MLQLPQSTVSRHLKTLADAGWVRVAARRDEPLLQPVARRARSGRAPLVAADPRAGGVHRGADQDERRLASVLARRRSKSEEFFSSASGQWDHLRAELFGGAFHLHALLGLLDPALVGRRSRLRHRPADRARCAARRASHRRRRLRRTCLHAARRRFDGQSTVDLRLGTLEAVPIDDGQVDVAMMALVLHHVPDPARALERSARASCTAAAAC